MSSSRIALACGVTVLLVACKSGVDNPVPTDLVVTPGTVSLTSINQTQQLSVAVKDQNGATMSGYTPTYSANAASVAAVSGAGLITALSAGTATVTVSAAGLSEAVPVTVTQVPATLAKVSGDAQTALESTQLPTALKVKVSDALGTGVAGVVVAFTISGGGTLNDSSVTTGATGEAQVTWTLGPFGSAQQITAGAGSLTSVSFTATATSAAALTIAKYAGDNQTVLVAYPTNIRPAVRITNALSQPVQGVNVTFAVAGGGGSISGSATIATNASGIAQVTNWVAGGSAGTNTLSATGSGSFSGSSSVSFTATAQTGGFNIVVRNIGATAFSAPAQAAFDAAEQRWETLIYGDLSDITFASQADVCFTGNTMNETIDDLLILARIEPIDGAGGTLGSAGDCGWLRTSNGLTMIGQMRFDSADVETLISDGTLGDVILHEMGHVLGFSGYRFDLTMQTGFTRDCIELQTSGTPPNVVPQDTHYTCALGRAMFDSIGGGSYTGGNKVPLENCQTGVSASCGSGTYNGHWREVTFYNELMTGYLNSGTNPLSTLTVSAMGDLGYLVNLGAASSYSRTFSVPSAERGPLVDLGNDILLPPVIRWVDDRGGSGRAGRP